MKFTRDKEQYNEVDREIEELKRTVNLEENDIKAIIIAALTTIVPFAILIFGLVMLVVWLMFT